MHPLTEAQRNDIPVGSAVCARVRRETEQGTSQEVCWLIRDQSDRWEARKHRLDVEFRFDLMLEPLARQGLTVALVPVLVRVGAESWENIYETWIDPLASGTLELLVYQQQVKVALFDEAGQCVRTLAGPNLMQSFARRTVPLIAARPPWSPPEFVEARQAIYSRYPDPWRLWLALEEVDPTA